MNNKKHWLAIALAAAICLTFAGCFNAATQPAEIPDETLAPPTTVEPLESLPPAPAEGQTQAQAFDWRTHADGVKNRIKLFSEIADCTLATAEQTAVVGLKFTTSYKGELTQRIKDMVAGELMAADPALTTVAVTSDPADYARIESLARRQQQNAPAQDLKPEIDQIAKNLNTLR